MGFLQALDGEDASHNASVYNAMAKKRFEEATADRTHAQTGYDAVSANGAQDRGTYNANFPNLYAQFANLAGISTAGTPGGGAGSGGGSPLSAILGAGIGRTPMGGGGGMNLNAPQRGGPQNSPYALSTPQQTQLNEQTDHYARQAQAGIDSYRQEAAAKGLPPNPEAEALISQGYSAMAEQGKANFQENERQQKEQATQTLMQLMMTLGQQGNNEQLQGAEGTAGLGAQAQNAGNSASQTSQQYGNQASEIWQGLASLITAGATGGISGLGGLGGGMKPGGAAGNQFPNYQAVDSAYAGNGSIPTFTYDGMPSGA